MTRWHWWTAYQAAGTRWPEVKPARNSVGYRRSQEGRSDNGQRCDSQGASVRHNRLRVVGVGWVQFRVLCVLRPLSSCDNCSHLALEALVRSEAIELICGPGHIGHTKPVPRLFWVISFFLNLYIIKYNKDLGGLGWNFLGFKM